MAFDGWWRWREKRKHTPRAFPATMAWLLLNPVMRAEGTVVLRRIDLAPGMKVLDVGCGGGRLTIPIAKRVGPSGIVVAFDLQQEMLDIVERRARAAGLPNVRTSLGGIGEGSLDEHDAFDRAVMVSVIGEVPEDKREPGLREILQALKPGGVLWVVEHFIDPDYRSPDTVRRLGESAGFEVAGVHRRAFGYEMLLRRPM